MSMIECEHCTKMIDSDDDPGCFVEGPDYAPFNLRGAVRTMIICEPCRELAYEQHQEHMEERRYP